MSATIIIFAISLFLLAALLVVKLRQPVSGGGVLSYMSDRLDPPLRSILVRVFGVLHRAQQSVPHFGSILIDVFRAVFLSLIVGIQKILNRIQNRLRGRVTEKKRGKVSFFLKHVADHKDSLGRD